MLIDSSCRLIVSEIQTVNVQICKTLSCDGLVIKVKPCVLLSDRANALPLARAVTPWSQLKILSTSEIEYCLYYRVSSMTGVKGLRLDDDCFPDDFLFPR